jgi:hypothetical protein
LAEGRDAGETDIVPPPWRFVREIYVPRVHDGVLQYVLMDIVAPGEQGNYWTVKEKPKRQPPPMVMVTSGGPQQILATAGPATSTTTSKY